MLLLLTPDVTASLTITERRTSLKKILATPMEEEQRQRGPRTKRKTGRQSIAPYSDALTYLCLVFLDNAGSNWQTILLPFIDIIPNASWDHC